MSPLAERFHMPIVPEPEATTECVRPIIVVQLVQHFIV